MSYIAFSIVCLSLMQIVCILSNFFYKNKVSQRTQRLKRVVGVYFTENRFCKRCLREACYFLLFSAWRYSFTTIGSLLLLLIMPTGILERIRVEINKGESTADEIFKKNNCCLANHRDTPENI